jgi:hypothetical protein
MNAVKMMARAVADRSSHILPPILLPTVGGEQERKEDPESAVSAYNRYNMMISTQSHLSQMAGSSRGLALAQQQR